MKRITGILTILTAFLFAAPVIAAGRFPDIPDAGREHYIIYSEGYRDGRIELAQFDAGGSEWLVWDTSLAPENPDDYKNDIKYYLDGDKWVEFERDYECISNNATEVFESDLNVYDSNGTAHLYGQNPDGTLKSFPEIKKDWNSVTQADYLFSKGGARETFYGLSDAITIQHPDTPYTAGHFIDVEGDIRPDEQRCVEMPDGYAVTLRCDDGTRFKSGNYGSAPFPDISRNPEICGKIYFTDKNFNIVRTVTADYEKYDENNSRYRRFLTIDRVYIVNGELYVSFRVLYASRYSDHAEFLYETDGYYAVKGDTVDLSVKYEKVCSATDKITIANIETGADTLDYAIIGGRTYVIKGEVTDRISPGWQCRKVDGYFVKTNITSEADYREGGDPEYYWLGLAKTLYFSKDYINFVSIGEFRTPVIKDWTNNIDRLDDMFYVYYDWGDYLNSPNGDVCPAQVFSKYMIDELIKTLPENPVYVAYGDKLLSFDTPPRIIDGRTMIPIRFLFETMGASVDWDDGTKTVVISNDKTKISVTVGNDTALVNGEEKKMDVGATIISDRTLIPLRFISEELGYSVSWDGDTRLVSIDE